MQMQAQWWRYLWWSRELLRENEQFLVDNGHYGQAAIPVELPLRKRKLTWRLLPDAALTPKFVTFDTRGLEVGRHAFL